MKKNLRNLLVTTALALTATAIPVSSSEPVEPAPPPPTEQVAQSVAHAQAEVARHMEDVHRQLADQQAKVAEAHARALELAQAARARTSPEAPVLPRTTGTNIRLGGARARAAGDAVVIQFSEPHAKSQADLEEDLAVMARVLDKTVAEQLGEERRVRAMGIDVFLTPASSSPRAFYLEDYGAVFLLNVPLPLLPPLEKTEPAKEKSETDAAWEEARRELYGGKPFVDDVLGKALRFEVHGETLPEYDAKKVDDLKEALLGALKNARNIRGLSLEDAITICVFGWVGDPQRKRVGVVRVDRGGKVETGTETDKVVVLNEDERAAARGSLLTIRIKKADADAFAAGQLDLPALEKKAKIALYAGGTGGASGRFGLNMTPY
jgi:hypothetical protein